MKFVNLYLSHQCILLNLGLERPMTNAEEDTLAEGKNAEHSWAAVHVSKLELTFWIVAHVEAAIKKFEAQRLKVGEGCEIN